MNKAKIPLYIDIKDEIPFWLTLLKCSLNVDKSYTASHLIKIWRIDWGKFKNTMEDEEQFAEKNLKTLHECFYQLNKRAKIYNEFVGSDYRTFRKSKIGLELFDFFLLFRIIKLCGREEEYENYFKIIRSLMIGSSVSAQC